MEIITTAEWIIFGVVFGGIALASMIVAIILNIKSSEADDALKSFRNYNANFGRSTYEDEDGNPIKYTDYSIIELRGLIQTVEGCLVDGSPRLVNRVGEVVKTIHNDGKLPLLEFVRAVKRNFDTD